jgi:hypothetical protein
LSRLIYIALLALCPLFAAAQTSMTATVAFVEGNAVVIGAKGAEKKLKVGEKVVEGDAVRLNDKTSRVILTVSDGTELRLKGKTEMRFKQFNRSASGKTRKTKLELAWGSFWAKVAKLTTKSSRFEVKEGGMVCGVRGTVIGGWYDGQTHEGGFYNFEGLVYTDNGEGHQDLPEGHSQPFTGNEYGTQGTNNPGDSNQFQFSSGGGNEGAGNDNGGSAVTQDILGDLTHDLGDAVNTQHDTDSNAAGAAQNNSNLKIQLDGPEGTGGGGQVK